MNKFLICIFVLFIAGNAQSGGQMNIEQLTQNKEVALNLSKAIMAGDWGKVDHLLADDSWLVPNYSSGSCVEHVLGATLC